MLHIPFHYFCTFLFCDEPDEFNSDTTDSQKSESDFEEISKAWIDYDEGLQLPR